MVLTTTWYIFNSQFYQQTDNVATGRPASSTTAEIDMQAHEQTARSMALHPAKVSEQFADDVYSILKGCVRYIFANLFLTSKREHS